ncbi:MAG: LPS export ABC transporter ATP-binding protein [Elusimicrobia bacterium]|nr:LPS export ABC transporter ATP-binding protein [Elusimicrobiota bacterium]
MSLNCEQLVKEYGGRKVVDGISISVAPGEIVGLLGPNGAGKTTTFNMIAGLIRPDSGEVYKGVHKITNMPMYRRARLGVGYLTQEPSIFRNLSVEDNLKAILQTVEKDKKVVEARAEELMQKLGIERLKKQKAFLLSGGEKRRLEIARSLISGPDIMLLDEPFVGIDPIAVADIQKIVFDFKEEGLGMLITDHNVRETLQVIDRAYIIYEGRMLFSGGAEELLSNPEARKVYLGEKFRM